MTPEELRTKILAKIDMGLSYRMIVRGDDRMMLYALRIFVVAMSEAELKRFLTILEQE